MGGPLHMNSFSSSGRVRGNRGIALVYSVTVLGAIFVSCGMAIYHVQGGEESSGDVGLTEGENDKEEELADHGSESRRSPENLAREGSWVWDYRGQAEDYAKQNARDQEGPLRPCPSISFKGHIESVAVDAGPVTREKRHPRSVIQLPDKAVFTRFWIGGWKPGVNERHRFR